MRKLRLSVVKELLKAIANQQQSWDPSTALSDVSAWHHAWHAVGAQWVSELPPQKPLPNPGAPLGH